MCASNPTKTTGLWRFNSRLRCGIIQAESLHNAGFYGVPRETMRPFGPRLEDRHIQGHFSYSKGFGGHISAINMVSGGGDIGLIWSLKAGAGFAINTFF